MRSSARWVLAIEGRSGVRRDIDRALRLPPRGIEGVQLVSGRRECRWAVLLSLKSLVETGKGAPEPNDIKIDNWN
jgi:hypothetical protein